MKTFYETDKITVFNSLIGFVLIRISLNCRCYDFINYFSKEESHSLLPSSQKLDSHSFFAPLYNASKKCYIGLLLFYPPRKHEKTSGFLIFSGVIKRGETKM